MVVSKRSFSLNRSIVCLFRALVSTSLSLTAAAGCSSESDSEISSADTTESTQLLTSGCSSSAMAFDGVSDWVNVPDLSLTGDFTIETWAKLDPGIGNQDALVGQESSGGPDLNFYDGKIRLYNGGSDVVVASATTAANVWTHYAVTRQNGALTIYVNGARNATGNWTGTFPVRALGRGAAGFVQGQLEELRIWNVARTAAQIAGAYQTKVSESSAGLLAYYVFNESSGDQNVINAVGAAGGATLGASASTEAADPSRVASTAPVSFGSECGSQSNTAPQVNAGPDGTATVGALRAIAGSSSDDGLPAPPAVAVNWSLVSGPGTPSWTQQNSASTSVTLPVEGTYVLRLTANDGSASSSDDVSITAQAAQAGSGCSGSVTAFDGVGDWVNIPDLSLTGNFTIEAWAKLDPGIDNKDALVGQESNAGPDLNFYDRKLRLFTGSDVLVANSAATENVWTHYAVTRQNGALTLFINGAQNATGNWTGTFPVRALGRGAAGFLQGQLDEMRIWNVARSASQISSSYQTQVSPTSSGLVAYYKFEESSTDQNVINAVGGASGATLGANTSAEAADPTRVACGGGGGGGGGAGQPQPLGVPGTWSVVVNEDFNGSAVDQSRWQIMDPTLPWTAANQYSTMTDFGNCSWRQANVAVSGGQLTLTQNNTGGTQYGGGLVSKFPLSYGFYEARVQFTSGWPAWWISSSRVGSDPIPQDPAVSGTEMDLAEARAWINPQQVSHSVHWNGYGSGHQSQEVHPGTADDGNWHTFGFWWTGTSYRFYVDGVLTWTFTSAISHGAGEYMLLNNAYWVGGATTGVARWDYVRYWTGG